MFESRKLALVLSAACLTAACDSEAAPDYPGEAVFTLRGKVVIEGDRTKGKLVPALAFETRVGTQIDFLDVKVKGEFPSDFELSVFDPPPKSALTSERDEAEELGFTKSELEGLSTERFAVGYITAVSEDHTPSLALVSEGTYDASCGVDGCDTTFEGCTEDGDQCYREVTRCDAQGENCKVIEMSGDPSIVDAFKSFAGLSKEYRVLYLEHAAAAESPLSEQFGKGKALAAGYHLLALEPPAPKTLACWDRAKAQALSDYNAANETTIKDFDACVKGEAPCEESTIGSDLDLLLSKAASDLDCPDLDEESFAPVRDPGATPITIRIAPNVGPFSPEGENF